MSEIIWTTVIATGSMMLGFALYLMTSYNINKEVFG